MKKLLSLLAAITLLAGLLTGGGLCARADGDELSPQEYLAQTQEFYDYLEQAMLKAFVGGTAYQSARAALDALEAQGAALTLSALSDADFALVDLIFGSEDDVFASTGDISRDGAVDSSDARMALQHEVQLIELTQGEQYLGDVSGDWLASDTAPYVVDSSDARLILQYEVHLIGVFPVDMPDLAATVEEFVVMIAEGRAMMESVREEITEMFGQEAVTALFAGFDTLEALLADDTFLSQLETDSTAALQRLVDAAAPLFTTFAQIGAMDQQTWDSVWSELVVFGITPPPYPAV